MTDRELQARKRIERELHDGVQQDLVAIVVKLQLARRLADADPAAAAALLDEIRSDAQAALDATRALALRIYPPLLDAAGLRAALRTAAPGAKVEVALGARCPEEITAFVYFCCLELVPGASAITVREEGDTVVFDVHSHDTPNLTQVQERIEALGGQLTTDRGRISGVLPI
jgi:signal transduction histidine kinase